MLNTRELEKRWLRYKIKSYIPYVVISISIIIIALISFIFFDDFKDEKKNQVITTKPDLATDKKESNYIQEEKNNTEIIEQPIIKQVTLEQKNESNQLQLKPSMGFIHHIQSEEQQPYYQTLHKTPVMKKRVKRKVVKQNIEEEYMDISPKSHKHKHAPIIQKAKPVVKEQDSSQKQVITIERRDSQKDIQDIIRRFKKNNNPALSLFIAKKSYEVGDYKQAYNYALITNGLNHNIEESWLIFAKSLVKLHKKDMAIKTLDEYIRYSHSSNARILLNDIKSGKFQ
jgi:hypothetical protein